MATHPHTHARTDPCLTHPTLLLTRPYPPASSPLPPYAPVFSPNPVTLLLCTCSFPPLFRRFETSAKDNINVDKAMLTLVQTILADDSAMHQPPAPSAGTVSLTATPAQTPAADSYMCSGCMK